MESRTQVPIKEVEAALAPFKISLSDEQHSLIARYVNFLLAWNQTVNLTALEDPFEIVSRHFGESIFADTIIRLRRGRLADVGTGAGFPGMALKIAFPELQVDLIEPNRKKCAFLNEVKQQLGLVGVNIRRCRYEDAMLPEQSFDFVCSRALGGYGGILRWARQKLKPSGYSALWLGTPDSILASRTNGWNWLVPVGIPESRQRVILVGRPAIT